MSEPIFDPTTERVYAQLPQHYRNQDSLYGYQLKRYLTGLLKSQDDVNSIIERLTYTPLDDGGVVGDTSDLVDPNTADLRWLPWLGQLFGTQVRGAVTEATRSEIINAGGFRAGTTDSVVAAAQKVLIGSKKVRVVKHADLSWQPDMAEHVIYTNLAVRPSFSSVANLGIGGSATVTVDNTWAQFGTTSAKIVSTGSPASALYASATTASGVAYINFEVGKTYTVSAYCRLLSANNTAGEGGTARCIAIGRRNTSDAIDYGFAISPQAPNAPGVTRLSTTFTVPENTEDIFIRLMNGSATAGDAVWFDAVQVTETPTVVPYFDGSTLASGGYFYRWTGDAHGSPSQQYIPAIVNTAGPWDMLIMTLQSETLKNLLAPSLSQTLSPSVWDAAYESFGYDPNNVWKLLVDQEDMYQGRAFSFALRDPAWQAGLTTQGGFGIGPFGRGTFGYSAGVTSRLRLLGHQAFNVVPTDSYQFLVSLGLRQDVLDAKRSAIGFQFYDTNGDVISNQQYVNLMSDPSFEYGVGAWAGRNSGVVAQDNTVFHTGANSLRITSGIAGGTRDAAFIGPALEAGKTYTLSAWMRRPASNTSAHCRLALSGTAFGTTIVSDAGPTPDEWSYVTVTGTAVASDPVWVLVYGSNVAGESVYIDDVTLVEGTIPQDFSGDTPDPVDGSVVYQWDGTPGASTSSAVTEVFTTPIDVVPTIVNNDVASHNFVKSSKVSNYAPYANDVSSLNLSSYGKYEGGTVIRAQVNNVVPTSEIGIYTTPTYGFGVIPAGTTFTFSLDAKISGSANANQLRVFFRDDTNGDNEAATFSTLTPAVDALPAKERWRRRSWTATVKADRQVTSIYVVLEGTTLQSPGAYIDTANWMAEEGPVANPYFNGNSPDRGEYRFQWEGVADASVTNKVLISVAESNKVDMQQYSTRFAAPAGATTAKVFVDMDGFNGKDELLIAQPAVREEEDDTWVPVSADPVQAVIDNGAKPAGVIMHYKPLTSSWDTVTANGTRPWEELERKWVEVEELGQ